MVSTEWIPANQLVRLCVNIGMALQRGRVFSTLRCDWWFAVLVEGLIEASLLRLVEGLFHHLPVQVQCKHLFFLYD